MEFYFWAGQRIEFCSSSLTARSGSTVRTCTVLYRTAAAARLTSGRSTTKIFCERFIRIRFENRQLFSINRLTIKLPVYPNLGAGPSNSDTIHSNQWTPWNHFRSSSRLVHSHTHASIFLHCYNFKFRTHSIASIQRSLCTLM